MSDPDILDDAPTNLWVRSKPARQPERQIEEHDDALWDVLRTARFLSMSRHWVYKAVAAGTIPYRKIGAAIRFVPAEIRTWADSSRRGK